MTSAPTSGMRMFDTYEIGLTEIVLVRFVSEEHHLEGEIEPGMMGTKPIIYVEVTLGRRLLSTVLTIYLPTILLNFIGFATNFFKVNQ